MAGAMPWQIKQKKKQVELECMMYEHKVKLECLMYEHKINLSKEGDDM